MAASTAALAFLLTSDKDCNLTVFLFIEYFLLFTCFTIIYDLLFGFFPLQRSDFAPLKNCAKIRKKEYEEVKIFVFFYVENVIL